MTTMQELFDCVRIRDMERDILVRALIEGATYFKKAVVADYITNTLTSLAAWERAIMAKSGKTTAARFNGDWRGFVDVRLEPHDVAALKEWEVVASDVVDLLLPLLQEGYRVGLAYNKSNDHYTASLTCAVEEHTNKGYTLSAFAPDPLVALKVLLYKHITMLDGVWSNAKASGGAIG